MIRRLTACALLASLFAAVPPTRADIVFSNFGSGLSYNTGGGNFIGNGLDGSGSNYAQGDTFTSPGAYTVTSVQIALSNFNSTNTDTLQVSLTADSSGTPGNVLGSVDIGPGTLGLFGNNNAPLTLGGFSGIMLAANTPYWVTVADISGGTDSNVWNWNSTGDSSAQATSTDGGSTWFSPSGLPAGAYEVNGVVTGTVPEPNSLLLLAGGVLGLLGDQWRRRRLRTRRPVSNRPEAESMEERVVLSTGFTWTAMDNVPAALTGTMLQLPNGNVMMVGEYVYSNGGYSFQGGQSNIWNVLQPDSTGNYANNSIPSYSLMNQSRLYYATNVLPNGNVFLLGGEDSSAGSETNTGEMFNASTSTWSNIANFPQPTFGDNSTVLLNDGLILTGTGAVQGYPYSSNAYTYLYNPTSSSITAMVNGSPQTIAPGTYSSGINWFWNESTSEEGFVKLPNGNVVRYALWVSNYFGPSSGGFAQLFNAATGEWQDLSPGDNNGSANGFIPALSAPTDPISGHQWDEMGPTLLLPNGNVFMIGGGTSNTALYNPSTNTWSAGPTIPYPYTADDAPAALMPNGDVIFTADAALQNGQYSGPTAFFDYSPGAGTITQLTGSNVPADPGLAYGSYPDRMLVLPTGQLMFSDANYGLVFIGTPTGAPQPQWRPVVQSFTSDGSGVYTLTGLRLNGLDAGASYGDDAEMDENYPIVRFRNSAGNVYYATTSNWSLLGVQTGSATETVTVTLPGGMPAGNYSMVVSGAGISSLPVGVHISSTSTPSTSAGFVQAAPISERSGTVARPTLLPTATASHVAGFAVLSPSVVAFGENGLGVVPTFSDTTAGPANPEAVDAIFAGGEMGWIDSANFGVKPRS